ncbi:MAG: PEP-CTERM sorting domain-containing protein [Candidatus Staskawiczbacteria bacterium]|jgi:hypothetical protein
MIVICLSSSSGLAAVPWENLDGSLQYPGIEANWTGSRYVEGEGIRSSVSASVILEDAYFDHGGFFFSSYHEDPTKFHGRFYWSGGFGANPSPDFLTGVSINRRGASLHMDTDVFSDKPDQLSLQADATLFPAVITADYFNYTEQPSNKEDPYKVEWLWNADFSFYGYWLPLGTMTAEEVGAMFVTEVPEPATISLLAIGAIAMMKRRR